MFIAWYTVMTAGYYMRFRFKTHLLSIPVYGINTLVLASVLLGDIFLVDVPLSAIVGVLAVVLIYILLFQARYYQLELEDILRNEQAIRFRTGGCPIAHENPLPADGDPLEDQRIFPPLVTGHRDFGCAPPGSSVCFTSHL